MPGFEASTWMVTWALAASVVASTAESKNCLFLFIVINCLFSGLFFDIAKVHKLHRREVDKMIFIV